MNTTDTSILKQFQTVLNRKHLTQKAYENLLQLWGLDKVDLDAEMQKINEHKSGLSRSRREAVPEFLKLRELLEKQESSEKMQMSFNDTAPIYQDTLTTN